MRESDSFRHDAIPDRLALTDVERSSVEARRAVINRHLAPAKPEAIKRAVGMVKGLMASTAVDGQSAAAILDGYAMVLGQYPQALIQDVCARFLDGRLGNRVYAPTPAEIAHECRNDPDIIAARAERHRLDAILNVEVYQTPSPAEQEKIQNEFQRYAADIAKASDLKGQRPGEPVGDIATERAEAARLLAERFAVAEAERKAKLSERAA